jgi:hypothetical protein
MSPQEQRLRNKLALWDTPGFSQFVEDLAEAIGPLTDVRRQVEVQKKLYKSKLQELQPISKFKQSKLEL